MANTGLRAAAGRVGKRAGKQKGGGLSGGFPRGCRMGSMDFHRSCITNNVLRVYAQALSSSRARGSTS